MSQEFDARSGGSAALETVCVCHVIVPNNIIGYLRRTRNWKMRAVYTMKVIA